VGLLWPEKTQEAARHSLSEALRRLRGSLGSDRLRADGDAVLLSDIDMSVDALHFERLAAADADGALALYRGDFLDGFALGDAEPFDEWAGGLRRRLRQRAVELLITSGEQALARGAPAAAADLALRATQMDSLGAAPIGLLMRARGVGGDAAAALAAFHAYARRVEAELGEAPDRGLAALAGRLRQQGASTTAEIAAPPEPPFIGSSAAATAFRAAADALRGAGPEALVVMGAPGMGRSRLLGEIRKRAALAGASVATARALRSDQDAGWSTLRQLMRSGLAGAPGIVAAHPETVGVAAYFAPELAERVAPVAPRDVGHVAGALAALIAAASDEAPVAIFVDDADLADGASLEALHGALRILGPSRVAVFLSLAADTDTIPRELLALSADIGGAIPGAFVRLTPLESADLHELVSALVPGEKREDVDRLSRRLAMETGGSPFWTITLLRALQASQRMRSELLAWPPHSRTFEAPLPPGVPSSARLAAASRLALLAPRERAVVLAAAVSGSPDPALLAAVTGQSPSEIDGALAELERASLLAFTSDRYAFTAPLLATVIRTACVTSGERERIRARAIVALDVEDGNIESAVLAAELMAERGPSIETVRRAESAGRAALRGASGRAAARALRAAEQACPEGDEQSAALVDGLRQDLAALGRSAG
jgi:DNA-binding SARP family transcriptional activator